MDKLGFKELVNITDMDLAFPNPSLIVQGGIIRKKPDLVDRFMRAYARGIHRARTDRELTLKSIGKYSKVDDPSFLQKAYDLYVGKVWKSAHHHMAECEWVDDLARRFPRRKMPAEHFIGLAFWTIWRKRFAEVAIPLIRIFAFFAIQAILTRRSCAR